MEWVRNNNLVDQVVLKRLLHDALHKIKQALFSITKEKIEWAGPVFDLHPLGFVTIQ